MKPTHGTQQRDGMGAHWRRRVRLSAAAFVRLWHLHAWVGVGASLALYLMCLTGALTLFHEQLELWEEPLAQRVSTPPTSLAAGLAQTLTALGRTPDEFWYFPPQEGRGEPRISLDVAGVPTTLWLDSQRGQLVEERERVAHLTYQLHFLWHELTGAGLYTVAGLLALMLLVALVTGTLVHLKDLVRQFHQFRPEAAPRVMWTDLHKVLGMMGLPFSLMYAYTGAFLVLGTLLLQLFVGPVFAGDQARAAKLSWNGSPAQPTAPGEKTAVWTLDALRERARSTQRSFEPSAYRVRHHEHAHGEVEIWGHDAQSPRALLLVRLAERDGAVLEAPRTQGAPLVANRWIRGLHFAQFGGMPLRALFFALALALCAALLSGNHMRALRQAREGAPSRWLARWNVGVGAGVPLALAVLFFASRVLPADLPARTTIEELLFFGVVVGAIGITLGLRETPRFLQRALAVTGALLALTPVLAARSSAAGLFGSGPRIAAVFGVDVALLVSGALLCACALHLARREREAATAHRTQDSAAFSVDGDADA